MAAAAGAAGGATIGEILAGVFIRVAASVAVSYAVNRLLAPNKNQTDALGRSTSVSRSSAESHKIIYGRAVTSGPLIFSHSTHNDKVLHLVVALAGHECDAVEDVLYNESSVTEDRYRSVRFANQTTISFDNAGLPATQGFIRSSVPLPFEKYFGAGYGIYIEGDASVEGLYFILDRPNNEDVTSYYLLVERVTGGDFSDLAEGTPITIYRQWTQAVTHTGHTAGNPFGGILNGVGGWTADHQLKGICAVYCVLISDPYGNAWPSGLPNIKARVRGKKVYDPRTDSWYWTDNWQLCVRDYLDNAQYGLGSEIDEIDEVDSVAGANICDQDVINEYTGETLKRYTCNGVVDTAGQPLDNLKRLLTAALGNMIWTGGNTRLLPAAYPPASTAFSSGIDSGSPDRIITARDLAGAVRVQTGTPRKERFNGVAGLFVDRTQNYVTIDYPTYKNPTYAAEDGEEILTTLDLPFTNDAYAAQRLAKLHLEINRQDIVVEVPGNYRLLDVSVNGIQQVVIDQLGWTADAPKYFRATNWRLRAEGGVDLVLHETAAAVYNWTTLDATEVDLSPNTTLPSPWDVDVPTDLALASGSSELILAGDGSILSRIKVSWNYPLDAFAGDYEVEWRKVSDALWTRSPALPNPPFWIVGVEDGVRYNVRVRAVNHIGGTSEWETFNNYLVVGKTEPPPDVLQFAVARLPDGTRSFTCSLANKPIDFAGVEIRYEQAINSPLTAWENLTPLLDDNGLVTAFPFETNLLAAGNYTVAAKMKDRSGNYSVNARYITSTLGDPRIAGALVVDDIHRNGYPGTRISSYVDDRGNLVPVNLDAWDDLPSTWDAWTAWNTNPASPITYEGTGVDGGYYDLGAVVSFTPLVTIQTQGGTGSVAAYERHKNALGDAWSAYTLVAGEVTGRYCQIKGEVTNPPVGGVNRYQVILSADTLEEDVTDLDTSTLGGSAGVAVIPLRNAYSLILSVQVALQGIGANWSWKLIDKDPSNLTIYIYNGATLADAVIDVHVIGLGE